MREFYRSTERIGTSDPSPELSSTASPSKPLSEKLLEKCQLCGLEQPVEGMGTDFRNGNVYCQDRVACWKRYDEQAKIAREKGVKGA